VWAIGTHSFHGVRVEPTPAPDEVHRRFPNHDESDSAARFLATITRFDEPDLRRQRVGAVEYIRREVASTVAASSAPPDGLARFLQRNASTLAILRAQLVSNPPPVWLQRADDLAETPQPDVILISHLFTTLAADALNEHSHRRDAIAWTDLGAIWVLAQSLWVRPEVPSVISALGGCRLIAAVASKLSPPAARWWRDFLVFDPRPPFARSLEYEAWALRMRAEKYPAGEPDEDSGFHEAMRTAAEPFLRPIRVMQADARVRDLRELARGIATADPCGEPPRGALRRWSGMLQRLDRFLLEREGVARLIEAERERARTGAWPAHVDARSVCRNAQWNYARKGDGVELSFRGAAPLPETRIVTPLRFVR
jgi:hypothetical protein